MQSPLLILLLCYMNLGAQIQNMYVEHCKPIPVMKTGFSSFFPSEEIITGIPVMRIGFPVMKTGFSL